MADSPFSYIVVEGPIGVGKTTLARRLAASYGAEIILEAPQDNPFLARFYENPRAHALPTQLFFLLQRVRQLQDMHQSDLFAPTRVGDYLVDKDRLFAELTLEPDELALYGQVYEQVMGRTVAPDLVIYLQAPVDVLMQRIANRALPYEAPMDAAYLERLAASYTRFFHDYDVAPLVIVNAAVIDIANNDDDYERLFAQIQAIRKGRHYINPLAF